MPFLTTQDGTEIYFADWGTGAPVVLIHGWPLCSDMWEKQATFLAEHGCRVIAYDRRGFGKSGQPWTGYDYDTFAGDLHSLLDKLDLHGVTLVGFSMGGGEVARYLSQYGTARVKQAVLLAAVTPFLLKTADNPEGIDASVFQGIDEGLRKDRPAFLKDFAPALYGRTLLKHTVSDADLEWTQSMALRGSLRATLAAAKAWSSTDFRDDLKRVSVPVRIIHGTGDDTVPVTLTGRKSLQLLPNATLTEYEGEPHGLFLTAADRLNKELLEFISPAAGA
ncbi:MAG: alpha/beta hydrolase [Acidobacteriota bacterium]|nr:alpha/beta hydrolase [Acidobacteriota bacterium]